jgi:serine/threonine protein kinase
MPDIGKVLLGKYEIQKRLGKGAWGEVYLAWDVHLKRQVALKCLTTDSPDQEGAIQRGLEAAQTVASVKHPNVVTIFGLETEPIDGTVRYYIVMEYAVQGTLRKRLERYGKLPIIQALDIAIAICRALVAVHSQGIIHRDVKPSNILLLGGEGQIEPKLSDFGLQAIVGLPTDEGAAGDYWGSLQYASLEQLHGDPVDHRSDLFSLGMVLYEMITGAPPFPSTDAREDIPRIIQSHKEGIEVPPSRERPEVAEAVDSAVMKALSNAPEARFDDAQAMLEALLAAKGAQEERQARVEERYREGQQYQDGQKWQEAVRCFEEVMSLYPFYKDTDQRLSQVREQLALKTSFESGRELCAQENWAAAVHELESVIDLDPTYAGGEADKLLQQARQQKELAKLYERALEQLKAEKWSAAIKQLRQIVAEQPDYREASEKLSEAKQRRDLEELYRQATALQTAGEWLDAEQALEKLGDYKDAPARLGEVREQKHLSDLYEEAQEQLREGDRKAALDAFDRLLARKPDYRDAAILRAQVWRQDRVEALLEEGRTLLENGEPERAVARLEELVGLEPDYEDAAELLKQARAQLRMASQYEGGIADLEEGRLEQAVEKLESVALLNPDYLEVAERLEEARKKSRLAQLLAQAAEHEEQERWADAIAVYSQILTTVDPQSEEARGGFRRASEHISALEIAPPLSDLAEDEEKEEESPSPAPEQGRQAMVATLGVIMILLALTCVVVTRFLPTLTAVNAKATEQTEETEVAVANAKATFAARLSATAEAASATAASEATGTAVRLTAIAEATAKAATETAAAEKLTDEAPTDTPTPDLTATFLANCTPQAELVGHSTMPNDGELCPGELFTASWQIRNVGLCPWPEDSRLVFVTGEPMGGQEHTIDELPAFTEMVTVSVPLVAPERVDNYEGEWQIQDIDGNPISEEFYVSIRVVSTGGTGDAIETYSKPQLGEVGIICHNVTFRWSWDGNLAADEWFAVRVGLDVPHSVNWVKEYEYEYSLVTTPQGWYHWEIAICQGDPEHGHCARVDGTELAVSERGTFYNPCVPPP